MDVYLNWHHGNIRVGAGGNFFRRFMFPILRGRQATKESLDQAQAALINSLNKIEKIWLPRNSHKKYMFGDEPSIADISLACELGHLESINFHNDILKPKYPSIYKWLYTDMMALPEYKKIHEETTARLT